MSTRVNGQTGAIPQPLQIESSPTKGLVTTKRWECTSAAAADSVTLALAVIGGWSWRKTYGPKPVVAATFGGDASDTGTPQATDTFELVFEDTQKDFLEADHFLTNSLTAEHAEQLRAYMNDPAKYGEDAIVAGTSPFALPSLDSRTAAEYLWKLWKAGFRSVEISQPIFRINRFVGRDYNTSWEYQDVGKIMLTGTMKVDSLAPADFLVPLTEIATSYVNPTRADGLLWAYGWKKYAPTLTVAALDKKQIQQQYKFGLWDVVLYNVPI